MNRTQYDKVLQAIARGHEDGARLVCGGKRPAGLDKGFYVQPTVFADVPEDAWIWNEEILGRWSACALSTTKGSRTFGQRLALRPGCRSDVPRPAALPARRPPPSCRNRLDQLLAADFHRGALGGYKHSGIGRELGEWGLDNYLETKQITRYDSDRPWGWYIK